MSAELRYYLLIGDQQALDDSVRAIAAAHVVGIVGERACDAETLARRALYYLAITDRGAFARVMADAGKVPCPAGGPSAWREVIDEISTPVVIDGFSVPGEPDGGATVEVPSA